MWRIFEKPKILARDVFETSQRRHGKDIFFEICSRRLKDVTQKTSFLRCIWDVLKTSQKRHLFWDVSERCLRYLSQWRSDWDLSETTRAGWESCSKKFLNIHRKAPALECLFKWKCRPSVLKLFQKEDSIQVLSCECYEIFKSTCFGEHLWTAAWTFSYKVTQQATWELTRTFSQKQKKNHLQVS